MQCAHKCLVTPVYRSNNDIQTPDQVSVPCTTPYFHKDTLTPPSSSRSPPSGEAGPARMRPSMHLYITHALYFEIYTTYTLLEVIQLMSIAGYETYVCMCIKRYVQPSYGCRGTPVVARMCVYTVRKIFLKAGRV